MTRRLAWVVVVFAGCGGSTRIDTGLPTGKTLGELSEAELRSACEAVASNSFPDDFIRGTCAASLSKELGVEGCKAQLEACVSRGIIGRDDSVSATCADPRTVAAQFQGCAVTVGAYETCLSDTVAQLVAHYERSTCEAPQTVTLPRTVPASCESVYATCPALRPG